MEIETEKRARKLMYKLAKERGLLPQIVILCADARKEGGKVGITPKEWTINGLLQYLGFEIEEKEGVIYPVLCEDK